MQFFLDVLETNGGGISQRALVSAQGQQPLLSRQSNGVCLGGENRGCLNCFPSPLKPISATPLLGTIAFLNGAPMGCQIKS